jgi:hypothetical protein
MRPSPGKDEVNLIDHGRVIEHLGFPDADFGWTLDDVNINTRARSEVAARRDTAERPCTCPECQYTWLVSEEGPICTSCGWMPAPKAQRIEVTEAELREINALAEAAQAAEIEGFYREALGWYSRRWQDRWQQREKSARWWAWCQARERYDLPAQSKPPSRYWWLAPAPVTVATGGWLHSRLIAYAKGRERVEQPA